MSYPAARAVVFVALASCGPRSTGNHDAGTGSADAPVDVAELGPDADLCVGGSLCGSPATCCPAGNDCVEDMCLTACASGVRCGVDLMTCCNSGEVCLENACIVPGAACQDPYDCEPGHFCEPTLDQCLPQPDPQTCKILPTFADLSVTAEWSWTLGDSISIPVVANLDAAGAPEVVANVLPNGSSGNNGSILILNGATGVPLLGPIAHNPPTTYGSHFRSTIAVGDVSGDGLADVIYAARGSVDNDTGTSLIVAIDRTGHVLWTSHDPGGAAHGIKVWNGGVTLANFDADPMAEVVIGATLIDHDGTVLWDQGGSGNGGYYGSNNNATVTYKGGISVVADLDIDGKPEIVSGKNAWKVTWNAGPPASATVTPYWTYSGDDGYPAVADLDQNGTPEVVLAANAKVIVLDGQTGQLFCAQTSCSAAQRVQPIDIACPPSTTCNAESNRGGPPTVADFDGDGRPEIGVAGGYSYAVYDLRRTGEDITGITPAPTAGQLFVRWTRATKDLSSNATGSSVFDFQGDGSSEVVYSDECNVWVYSGTDGRTQLQLPNTTGTIHEYPLVVDADGDGNSEILVVANGVNAATNCPAQTANKGIYLYGDPLDRWVPTRKVWPQHTYHITNATPVGNVPVTEANNWTQPGLNDYRKNAQGEGVFNAPDLAVELSVGLEECDGGMLVLKARVTNVGALGVHPGAQIVFKKTDANGAVLGTATTTVPLLPGGSTTVSITVPTSTGPNFYVAADGPAAVAECNESNNSDATVGAMCPIIL
ncbi:MAG: CARDB domain-containing protein [Kofleriaceae bacterium]|nr:CARDB domain-containing protein [Kofleriaceae bacterium]